MLGSELVIRALAREGVRTIFSLSGNQIMPLYDACIDAGIRIVHVRHEAAAVFMADAWAQVTGEIGVAMLTAGPGLSNGVAPLFSALHAESPLLLLSGDSPTSEDGMGSFQELDQATMTRPATKLSRRVSSFDALRPSVHEAIAVAMAPRRGPVHLALPFDLLTAQVPDQDPAAPALGVEPRPVSDTDLGVLGKLLTQAQRPVILAGPSACRGHARPAWDALTATLQAPVISMESPRGLRDPSIGAAAQGIAQADVVVLAGKRLDFTLGFGKPGVFSANAQVVVIDPDATLLERAHSLLGSRLCLALQADPIAALQALAQRQATSAPRHAWRQQVAQAVASREQACPVSPPPGAIGSRHLCEQVQTLLAQAQEPILVCDGGEFGQWAQAFCRAPVRLINGVSGAIGGGICYAIAAKIARPQATVVVLMGDGTSGFHFMEFDTAVRENAPFVAVIGNDDRWNAEHLIQLRDYGEDRLIGCALAPTSRYESAAAALGALGCLVSEPDQLGPALQAAVQSQTPACVNVRISSQPAPVFTTASASVH